MTWTPISGTVPQYQKSDGTLASGYYLKFYAAGTTTPLSMATDSTGGTTLAKCQINSSGYPINGSSDVFIPHISKDYKIVLYKNSTDADADTTANAEWVVDPNKQTQIGNTDLWNLYSGTPTQTSATTFTVTGDQTSTFVEGLRLKFTDSSTLYGVVSSASFSSVTTVTVVLDSGSLSGSLSAVYTSQSIPTKNPVGSKSVSYLPEGTGAVATNVQAKLRESVSVADFGAVTSDSGAASTNVTAFQNAAATGKSIRLEPNATYYLNDGFEFSTDRQCLFGNKAKIITTADFDKTSNTFEVVYLNANYCTVYDTVFDCALTATASNNNRIVWTEPGKTNNRVTGCEFYSVPSGAANLQTAIGFGLACSYSKADNNFFSGCPGSVFSQGARTIITKNITLNPKDVSYAVNSTSADACSIVDNKSYNAANTALSVHIAAEEGASNWIITDNEIYGVKDGAGISALNVAVTTTVRGGKIHNNIVNGGGLTCTSPSALISVSQYYTNAKITNNEMFNPPAGLSTNSALSVPTNGTFVRGNDISGDSGMAGVVLITPSGGRMQIENNKVNGNSAARLFVVNNGDNSGEAISFRNGIYLDATEAINTALNSPTNCPIEIYNPEYETCTSFTNIGATSWGDRSTFFNTYNAYRWPVHISSGRTVMYGNAAPTSGSWQQGDKILNVVPTGGTPTIGWVCVGDGIPGTWVAF